MDPSSANDKIKQAVAPVLAGNQVLVEPISTLSVMFLVYGTYIILFGISIHVLCRPNRPESSGLYLGCTITLFVLATIYNIFIAWGDIRQALICFEAIKTNDYLPLLQYLSGDSAKAAIFTVSNVIFALMNIIADAMLIHRCYIIWGSKKLMLFPLVLVAFVVNVISLASVITAAVGFVNNSEPSQRALFLKASDINDGAMIAVAAFSLLVTLLTGGRIWWVSREARKTMGQATDKRYKAIIASILESGALYSVTLLVTVLVPILVDPTTRGFLPINLGVLSSQMAGLGPTLIIVRVAYGKAVESSHVDQGVVSTLHFAERNERRDTVSGIRTVDLPSQTDSSDRNVGGELEVSDEKMV